jgi:hypothetical protein
MQPAKEKRAKRSICAKREARQRLTIQWGRSPEYFTIVQCIGNKGH